MEIVIKSEGDITTITIEDKHVPALVDAIYWFLKDNYIPSVVVTKNI